MKGFKAPRTEAHCAEGAVIFGNLPRPPCPPAVPAPLVPPPLICQEGVILRCRNRVLPTLVRRTMAGVFLPRMSLVEEPSVGKGSSLLAVGNPRSSCSRGSCKGDEKMSLRNIENKCNIAIIHYTILLETYEVAEVAELSAWF